MSFSPVIVEPPSARILNAMVEVSSSKAPVSGYDNGGAKLVG